MKYLSASPWLGKQSSRPCVCMLDVYFDRVSYFKLFNTIFAFPDYVLKELIFSFRNDPHGFQGRRFIISHPRIALYGSFKGRLIVT